MSSKLADKQELKACPFCGSKVNVVGGIGGIQMFTCVNFRDCGAVMSFNNPIADHFPDKAKIYYNRRSTAE